MELKFEFDEWFENYTFFKREIEIEPLPIDECGRAVKLTYGWPVRSLYQ